MITEELYTLEEVCKHLRVPIEAVQQEVNSGRLRAIIIGGEHIRVREGDLEKYKSDSYAQAIPPTQSAPPSCDIPIDLHPAPDFRHIWPDGKDEQYTNVLEGIASFGGKEYHVKVGFTTRNSAGQKRARTLVLVDRYPTVEFVAASETVQPEDRMASIIRDRRGKQLPVGATLPAEYVEMSVGPYRDVVVGPGASNGLAVICAASDTESMVKHALIRYQFREQRQ
jgi:excisionase family DNA binding protein